MSTKTRTATQTCSTCHTPMVRRTPGTREQAFAGTWYDHPTDSTGRTPFGHPTTILVPSEGLTRSLRAQAHAA